jgi:hypothetical protein
MDLDKLVTLPWYVIVFYTIFIISWITILARQEKANSRDIALLKASYQDIDEDIKSLRETINDRMDRQDHQIEKMQDKIDRIFEMVSRRNN